MLLLILRGNRFVILGLQSSSTNMPSAGLPSYSWQVRPLPSAGRLIPNLRLASSCLVPCPLSLVANLRLASSCLVPYPSSLVPPAFSSITFSLPPHNQKLYCKTPSHPHPACCRLSKSRVYGEAQLWQDLFLWACHRD